MFKILAKTTDAYKAMPKDVKAAAVQQVGEHWHIYVYFEDKSKKSIGRYKTEQEAKAAFETIKNITNSNKNK